MLLNLLMIALTLSLISWQLWSESRKSFVLGILSMLLIGATAFVVFSGGLFNLATLTRLSINLLFLSVLSFGASKVRKYVFLRLPFLAVSTYLMFLMIGKSIIPGPAVVLDVDSQAELLVQVKSDAIEDFRAFAQKDERISIETAFHPLRATETDLDDWFTINILDESPTKINTLITEITAMPDVLSVEKNEIIQIPELKQKANKSSTKSEFLYEDPLNQDQWALSKSNMNEVYKMMNAQKPLHRAALFILDTGIDGTHEDLIDAYQSIDKKYDQDVKEHGTHCAGIAAAMTGNKVGISSFNAGALYTVSSIKVLADYGGGTQQGIIKGMIQAIDSGADVISMSLGGRSTDSRQKAYNQVVAYAAQKNVIIVVAAGNSSANAKFYAPANSKGVITVAAVDENMQPATFTNTLQDIEMGVSAPGVNILSTTPGNNYKKFSGTSMATPFVAGLIALMKSYEPELNTAQAYELLESTGIQNSAAASIKSIVDPSKSLEKLLKKSQ